MTIDEAIKHCHEVAEQNEAKAQKIGVQFLGTIKDREATECRECASDHRQLAEWLTELKEAKRLLEVAIKDLNATVAEVYNDGLLCKCCEWKSQTGECCCHGDGGCDVAYQWRYTDEALKLIGGETDEHSWR